MSNKLTKQSGIYQILNIRTGFSYIGQSQDISARCRGHRADLKKGRDNRNLQAAYDAGCPKDFECRAVVCLSLEFLSEAEDYWIDYWEANGGVYNSMRPGKVYRGRKHSLESRQKMSKSHMGLPSGNLGRPMTTYAKQRLLEANLGRVHSEEEKEKCRIGRLNNPITPEARHAMGSGNRDKSLSQEAISRLSSSRKGNKSAVGHKQTQEHKDKIGLANKLRKAKKFRKHLKVAQKAVRPRSRRFYK